KQALDVRVRRGRLVAEALEHPGQRGVELGGRADARHQADGVGRDTRDLVVQQRQLLGPGEADQPREAKHGAVRDDAVARGAEHHHRVRRGQAQVARHRELQPAADGVPVQDGDRHLRGVLETVQSADPEAIERLADVAARQRVAVHAGAERAAGAAHDDRVGVVRLRVLHRVDERGREAGVERVEHGWPRQRDHADAVPGLVGNGGRATIWVASSGHGTCGPTYGKNGTLSRRRRMRQVSRRRFLMSAGGAVLAASAPRVATAQASVKVGTAVLGDYSLAGPFIVATEKGFFHTENLNAEYVPFRGGPNLVKAVIAGDILLGAAGSTDILVFREAGMPLKMVATHTEGNHFTLNVAPEIQRLSDLKG